MRKLIICGTNYQVILAIHLKLTLFNEDKISIWISDFVPNSAELVNRINDVGIFEEACLFESKSMLLEKSKLAKLNYAIKLGLGWTDSTLDCDYDEILTYNFDINYYHLINKCERRKKEPSWSKLEEGLFSYNTDFYIDGNRFKIIEAIRKLRKKDYALDKFNRFYASFPQYKSIHSEWENCVIPSILNDYEQLKPILMHIYNYYGEDINKKYIVFASASDIDGHGFGETEIIKNFAQSVGKENVIIKMHPRDNRTVYSEFGLEIMKNSAIPWEIMQIVNNFKDKVLVTITSGAFISIEALCDLNTSGILLYPEIKKFDEYFGDYVKRIDDMINSLHKDGRCLSIKKQRLDELNEEEGMG